MKISYRTHPVLGLINGETHSVGIDASEIERIGIIQGLNFVFATYKERLTNNVIIVSEPFIRAAETCIDKMMDNELFKEIGDHLTGVVLFGKVSIIYDAERVQVDGKSAWALNIIEFFAGAALRSFSWEGIINYTYHDEFNETAEVATKNIWLFVQTVLMFKKFAQVEIKEIPAGKKIKGTVCNYKNETKTDVLILDSKWFTTLVKSDAFKVRGHFRLQPKKKDGVWTKELIWINDFQKEGYTAPARKLNDTASKDILSQYNIDEMIPTRKLVVNHGK